MGIMDAISPETRVELKLSDLHVLIKGCTERDVLVKAVKTRVPHKYIERIITGEVEK